MRPCVARAAVGMFSRESSSKTFFGLILRQPPRCFLAPRFLHNTGHMEFLDGEIRPCRYRAHASARPRVMHPPRRAREAKCCRQRGRSALLPWGIAHAWRPPRMRQRFAGDRVPMPSPVRDVSWVVRRAHPLPHACTHPGRPGRSSPHEWIRPTLALPGIGLGVHGPVTDSGFPWPTAPSIAAPPLSCRRGHATPGVGMPDDTILEGASSSFAARAQRSGAVVVRGQSRLVSSRPLRRTTPPGGVRAEAARTRVKRRRFAKRIPGWPRPQALPR